MSEPRGVMPRRVVSAHRAVQICGGLALLGASLFASPRCMGAGSFTVLHSFAGGAADGAFPATGVILDGSGYLYGTSGGGSSNLGAVFKVKNNGTGFTVLHSFESVSGSGVGLSGLVMDGSGNLYGASGGDPASNSGFIYSLKNDGTGYSILHTFHGGAGDGSGPSAALILDGSENLYGTTSRGGGSNLGVVFTMKTAGTGFKLLHTFAGSSSDGAGPLSPLILDGSGNLFGTTKSGGSAQVGVVFTLKTDGSGYKVLHSFESLSDGQPCAGLLLDAAGNLFGTTIGSSGLTGFGAPYGNVFKLRTNGTGYAILHPFLGGSNDGASPYTPLIFDSSGNLIGTTTGGGAAGRGLVFTMKADGSSFVLLHSFEGADGAFGASGVIFDAFGNLYGTTSQGGSSNKGVVFRLGTGPGGGPPVATWILPSSAHSPGANGAFYTTDLSVSNTGPSDGTFTVKFLGHDTNGTSGPEATYTIGVGMTTVLADVLGTAFGATADYGALQINSSVTTLVVAGETSTRAPACVGGTFGQSVPAVGSTELIAAGSSLSITGVRENSAFRTNLILANSSSAATDVNVDLYLGDGTWGGSKSYHLEPLGMHQVTRVIRDIGYEGDVSGARLILTPTLEAVAAYASAIDNFSNDPRTLLPR